MIVIYKDYFFKDLFDSIYVSRVNSENIQTFIVHMIFYCSKRHCSGLQERWKDETSENFLDHVNTRAETLEGKEAVLPWKRKVTKKSKGYFGFGLSKSYQHQTVKESYHQVYFMSPYTARTWENADQKNS